MELKNKIRFVHHNPEFGTKFTIAYHRDENFVVFAWTELYHTDEYVKSVGRQVATERLLMFVDGVEPLDGLFDVENKVGVFVVDHFKNAISNVIADTLLAKMTLMDFKHAAVSNALRSIVLDSFSQLRD